jgi:ABC-type nitrate/sulfonate/bicarbonate transport system substrate-binding protein
MTSRFIGFVFCLVLTLFQLSTIPPASAQLFKLKTSYSALTANMAAYWLAKETRLFEKHGLDVDVVLIESGTTTIQALVAGETQIAMGGGTVAVSSALAGADLISIASIESRLPYGLLAQKEIKTLEQLKGKKTRHLSFRQHSGFGIEADSAAFRLDP